MTHMTAHHDAYHSYCECCANYRVVQRYPTTSNYYCRGCTGIINRALKRRKLDPGMIAEHPEWHPMIDEIVTARQQQLSQKRKVTKRDAISKWKPRREK